MMTEVIHALRWAWHIRDNRLIERVDQSIARKFTELGYTSVPGDLYLGMYGYSSVPKRDMMTAFIGNDGAFLLCANCQDETRGLHLHITSGNPFSSGNKIYEDMLQVNDSVKRGTLLISSMEEAERMLGTGWNRILAAVGLGGSLAGLLFKPVIQDSILYPALNISFAFLLLLSIIYALLSIGFPLFRTIFFLVKR